ncbi:MAG: hypothetical protein RL044_864, partial [Actinomycetota bacterium]
MRRLGQFITNHSKLVLFGFVGLIIASTFWGFQVFGNLKGGGYDNPNSDSALVQEILESDFGVDPAELIVLVDLPGQADSMTSSGPEFFPLVQDLTDEIADIEGVESAVNYYMLGSPPQLKSEDGKLVYLLVDLDNSANQAPIVKQIV